MSLSEIRSSYAQHNAIFIIDGFVENKKMQIPLEIKLLTLFHIGVDTICEWQLYLFYVLNKHKQFQDATKTLSKIRTNLLLHGCAQNITDVSVNTIDDTVRGKLWRLLIGLTAVDSDNYQNQINKRESVENYSRIRTDTKRAFLSSSEYRNRVPESRLVRLLNSYVQQYQVRYRSGWESISAVLLYVMPEVSAFETFRLLNEKHFATYFHENEDTVPVRTDDRVGAYVACHLSKHILKIYDTELFNHLQPLHIYTYLFPINASIQTISQPFVEIPKLWDFLFCFGFHLNPIMTAAQIIVNKTEIMSKTPNILLQGLFSQRRWMNQTSNAKDIIDCTLKLIVLLKEAQYSELWQNVLYHSSDINVAISVRNEYLKSLNMQPIEKTEGSKQTTNIEAQESKEKNTTESDEESSSDASSDWVSSSNDTWGNPSSFTDILGNTRFPQLNEFELKNCEVQKYDDHSRQHNQLLCNNHREFVDLQNNFVAMDRIDDTLIKLWSSNI